MKITSVLETCLYVDDLETAEAFYGSTLGLSLLSKQEDRHVFFRLANQMLLIFDRNTLQQLQDDLPSHSTTGAGHLALAIHSDDLETWKKRLAKFDVPIEHEADWGNGRKSIYFRDPAGNSIELASPTIWGLPEPD